MLMTLRLTLLCVFLFSFQTTSCNKAELTMDPIVEPGIEQKRKADKTSTISELNSANPSKGIFKINDAFVIKIYKCPKCPPNAQCKPCMGNHIVISEEASAKAQSVLSENEMIIFTKNPESFAKGRMYGFLIEIRDEKSTSNKLNDARLIRANPNKL